MKISIEDARVEKSRQEQIPGNHFHSLNSFAAIHRRIATIVPKLVTQLNDNPFNSFMNNHEPHNSPRLQSFLSSLDILSLASLSIMMKQSCLWKCCSDSRRSLMSSAAFVCLARFMPKWRPTFVFPIEAFEFFIGWAWKPILNNNCRSKIQTINGRLACKSCRRGKMGLSHKFWDHFPRKDLSNGRFRAYMCGYV